MPRDRPTQSPCALLTTPCPAPPPQPPVPSVTPLPGRIVPVAGHCARSPSTTAYRWRWRTDWPAMFTSNSQVHGTWPGCPRQHHCHRARRPWRCTGACTPGNRFSRGFPAAGNSSRTHRVFTNFCLGGDVMARPPAPPPVGSPRAQPTRGNSPRCAGLVEGPQKQVNQLNRLNQLSPQTRPMCRVFLWLAPMLVDRFLYREPNLPL